MSAAAKSVAGYTAVLNGRFKGGYITRTLRPTRPQRIHAIQLELSQRTYMNESAAVRASARISRRRPPGLRVLLETYVRTARGSV